MSEKLLPCPFCGEHATEIATCMQLDECAHFEECPAAEPYVCMVCSIDKGGCGASTGYYDSAEKANAAWNRRAQPENARQHTLQTGVCPMCEDCPDGCPVEAPNDSRNKPENEPLTLDELRQMDGEPVWIQESAPYTFAGYKILCSPVVDEYEDVCFEGGDCYYSHDYGDTWLAYRAKPERSET